MSGTAPLSPDHVRAAAAAIANARAARHGSPTISNVLEVLPESLLDEVVEDARAALKAAAAAIAAEPPVPRRPGPLNAADASALALDVGADALTILATQGRRAHGVVWGRGLPTKTLTPEEVAAGLIAFVRAVDALPDPEEPQP